jgi:hypothetical protein
MRSQGPDKRVVAVLKQPSGFRSFLQYPIGSCIFPLPQEKKNSTTQSEVSVFLSHIIAYFRLKIVTESVTKWQILLDKFLPLLFYLSESRAENGEK